MTAPITPIEATVEEPTQGTWVADLDHTDPYPGSFLLGGVTWTGVAVSSVLEGTRYRTRVVGGKGGISTQIKDQYYYGGGSGNTLVSDIARACGETATPALPARVATWARQAGTAGSALDALAGVLGSTWWIGRDGTLQAAPARPGGAADVSAWTRTSVDTDGEQTYAGEDASKIVPGMILGGPIAHIRWELRAHRLTAETSLVPFAPPVPAVLDYLRGHRAVVESQETDGTVNLIVGNRFSLTKVPFQGGIPGITVLVPGDVVTAQSWGGDPRQWFCHSVQRTPGAAIGRVGDTIDCGILVFSQIPSAGPGSPQTVAYVGQALPGPKQQADLTKLLAAAAPGIPFRVPVTGVISSGSDRVGCA